MSRIWHKDHEKKSKRASLSFTIFASLPFSPCKGARHARHPLRPGLFTMIAQLPIEAQLARGKMGVGIVNLAFDGWETTTPVEWTNISFFFVIGVCFKQWCQSQLQSRDNFELSAYMSFAMWYDVRWLRYESSTLILYKELSSTIFPKSVNESVRHPWHLSRSPFCSVYKGIDALHWPSIFNYQPATASWCPILNLYTASSSRITHSWANWI